MLRCSWMESVDGGGDWVGDVKGREKALGEGEF